MIFVCYTCGKKVERFYMDEYVYKKSGIGDGDQVKTIYFCGWNCMRKYEKEMEKKQHEKRTGKSNL